MNWSHLCFILWDQRFTRHPQVRIQGCSRWPPSDPPHHPPAALCSLLLFLGPSSLTFSRLLSLFTTSFSLLNLFFSIGFSFCISTNLFFLHPFPPHSKDFMSCPFIFPVLFFYSHPIAKVNVMQSPWWDQNHLSTAFSCERKKQRRG